MSGPHGYCWLDYLVYVAGHRLRHPHVPHPPHAFRRRGAQPEEQLKRNRAVAMRRLQQFGHGIECDPSSKSTLESAPSKNVANTAEGKSADRIAPALVR